MKNGSDTTPPRRPVHVGRFVRGGRRIVELFGRGMHDKCNTYLVAPLLQVPERERERERECVDVCLSRTRCAHEEVKKIVRESFAKAKG